MKINRPAYIYDVAGLGGFACIPPLSPADINHFYILPTSTPRKPGKGQKEKILVFWDQCGCLRQYDCRYTYIAVLIDCYCRQKEVDGRSCSSAQGFSL